MEKSMGAARSRPLSRCRCRSIHMNGHPNASYLFWAAFVIMLKILVAVVFARRVQAKDCGTA
jgi:hypothetical protein